MGFHQTIVEGRLGRDVELRHTQSGVAIGNFSVAVSYRKKVSGEWTDATQWYSVTTFAKQAENCEKFLSKGSPVLVVGHSETDEWTDKEGNPRRTEKLIAHTVQFLSGGEPKQERQAPQQQSGGYHNTNTPDPDDTPF